MILSGSVWRKAIVTVVAAGGFVSLYEATILDSKYVARFATPFDPSPLPAPGSRLTFTASAYCKGLTTTSGVPPQTGVVAADPELLPVGSIIDVRSSVERYDGIYTVMDTGPHVLGRHIDVYMWSCNEALRFGRRSARVTVVRLGWNPHATSPGLMNRLFRRAEPAPLPSRPLPLGPPPAGDKLP